MFIAIVGIFYLLVYFRFNFSNKKWIEGNKISTNYFSPGDIVAINLNNNDTLIGHVEGWKKDDSIYLSILNTPNGLKASVFERKIEFEDFDKILSKIAINDILTATILFYNPKKKSSNFTSYNKPIQFRDDPNFIYGIIIFVISFFGWLWLDKRIRPFNYLFKAWRILSLLTLGIGITYIQLGELNSKIFIYFLIVSVIFLLISSRYGIYKKISFYNNFLGSLFISVFGIFSEAILYALEYQHFDWIIFEKIQLWVVTSILFFIYNIINTELLRINELKMTKKKAINAFEPAHITFNLNNKLLKQGLSAIAEGKLTQNQPEEMAMALAEYYRYATNRKNEIWTTVGQEINTLEALLKVEDLCNGSIPKCIIHCETELQNVKIPKFIVLELAAKALQFIESYTGSSIEIEITGYNISSVSIKFSAQLETRDEQSNDYYEMTKKLQSRLHEIYGNNWQILFCKFPKFGIELILPFNKIGE